MFKKNYKPIHALNRMKNEGDVSAARNFFFTTPSNNLIFLLQNRFEWMNKYITSEMKGIEVGAGSGLSKQFIKGTYFLTDYSFYDWLDIKNVDALATPFQNGEFDFVVSSNMIHHVPYPVKFFEEMQRILKPGGIILIQEINASFFMCVLLKLMRHEGYDFTINVFDSKKVATDPEDLWSANCAIPNLLFDNIKKFEEKIPYFKIEKESFSEFFNFINSGGVVAKTFYIPLPKILLKIIKIIDTVLVYFFPKLFALQRQIVLRKIK